MASQFSFDFKILLSLVASLGGRCVEVVVVVVVASCVAPAKRLAHRPPTPVVGIMWAPLASRRLPLLLLPFLFQIPMIDLQ